MQGLVREITWLKEEQTIGTMIIDQHSHMQM